MKVLVAVTDTKMGGITTSAVNFCNELSKRRNDVYFLDMSSEYLCDEFLDDTVKRGKLNGRSRFWNLRKSDLIKGNVFRRILLSALGALKKITNKSNRWNKLIFKRYKQFGEFDVAIAFRQCSPCYSFVLDKVQAKKKIGFVHGELKYMGDISSWKNYMIRFDKIAYVSNAVRDEFIAAFPELKNNATTIYNMFNTSQILELSKAAISPLFNSNVKNIITVARLDNEYKRINWIPEICKKLKKRCCVPFCWYIVGDGPDKECLEQSIKELQVADVLVILGAKKNPYAFLSKADLSVLVSKSEAYPMTVIESFILEIPIVVTRFATIVEMMTDEKEGLIAESEQDDCVLKIIEMLSNEKLYSQCKAYLAERDISNQIPYQQFINAIDSEERL